MLIPSPTRIQPTISWSGSLNAVDCLSNSAESCWRRSRHTSDMTGQPPTCRKITATSAAMTMIYVEFVQQITVGCLGWCVHRKEWGGTNQYLIIFVYAISSLCQRGPSRPFPISRCIVPGNQANTTEINATGLGVHLFESGRIAKLRREATWKNWFKAIWCPPWDSFDTFFFERIYIAIVKTILRSWA